MIKSSAAISLSITPTSDSIPLRINMDEASTQASSNVPSSLNATNASIPYSRALKTADSKVIRAREHMISTCQSEKRGVSQADAKGLADDIDFRYEGFPPEERMTYSGPMIWGEIEPMVRGHEGLQLGGTLQGVCLGETQCREGYSGDK